MIDRAAFEAMKAGAYIVNIARGSLIDETALIKAARTGKIAAAGLDVTEQEPLPPESPLWSLPNVVLTPHVAGLGSLGTDEHRALFAANLERFRSRRADDQRDRPRRLSSALDRGLPIRPSR